MKILLTPKELADICNSVESFEQGLLAVKVSQSQAKKIAKLIEKDTHGNLFGLSDKLYKALMEIK